MEFDKDFEGAEKSLAKYGSGRRPDSISLLPEEIFINIIQLSINADAPVHDLDRLTAVCRRWKWVLEDAPTLWSGIAAADGLGGLRKALRMVQDAPLDVEFDGSIHKVDIETFFQEARTRISQWRTLIIRTGRRTHAASPTYPASTAPPRLELLHLIYYPPGAQPKQNIALFGGEPAPISLRDVCLEWTAVAVAPLRLSGLTSLVLESPAQLPVEELIRIIKESPALQRLHLSWWGNSPSHARESAHSGTSEDARIWLTSLRSLIITDVPASHIRMFISTLRFPNLETFHLGGTIEGSPVSNYFAIDTDHLIQSLQRGTRQVDRIRISVMRAWCSVSISDRFCVQWAAAYPLGLQLEHIREVFEWLFTHLGDRLKDVPTTLHLRDCSNNLPWMDWVSSNLKVTELTLYADRSGLDDPNKVVPFLSHPVSFGLATSPPQWLFPSLEVFCSVCPGPLDVTIIADMVQERHSAIGNEDVPGTIPKPFRKIRLAYAGLTMFTKELQINEEALKTIKRESKGAEVYWEGVEWTRT